MISTASVSEKKRQVIDNFGSKHSEKETKPTKPQERPKKRRKKKHTEEKAKCLAVNQEIDFNQTFLLGEGDEQVESLRVRIKGQAGIGDTVVGV